MKKVLLLAAAIMVNFYSAQTDSYGLKAGLNISSLSTNFKNEYNSFYSVEIDSRSKVGVYLGAYIERKYTEKSSLNAEALLSFQGARLSQTQKISIPSFGYGSSNYNKSMVMSVNFTQLNIPVYYKYKTNERFAIYGGGYLGLTLSSSIEGLTLKNNTLDLGLIAGASYAINNKFSAEARYNLGLLNLDEYYKFKNRTFQLGISYQLK
ncbi:PorT family protein [Riemerella anatipestifer]|uniref:porin family protein n=1 Tax=Riemerella anatipestifer TaxID=34085 RepID=UPI00129E9689|nr:porin family protein [Riemerella anatipestifer]MRN00328.1 PorT family protein [Riemerella anatipestifer]MRN02662.1 PorT family protein [Riemerella anatipestifer]